MNAFSQKIIKRNTSYSITTGFHYKCWDRFMTENTLHYMQITLIKEQFYFENILAF